MAQARAPGRVVQVHGVPVGLSCWERQVPKCGVLGVGKADREAAEISTHDVGVMWRMVDGVPTIAWTGFDNFTPIAP